VSDDFTLPSLQASLDRLPIAKSLALANTHIEKLFGFNDVAASRLERFARGHNCIVTHTDRCVVFHKMPAGPVPR
jgi:hypothetical protein